MTVCIVDTSVFCELLRVPGCFNDAIHQEVKADFQARACAEPAETFLLPMTTILETGNHIGQHGDGRQRRAAAERFVAVVRDALDGSSPFTATPMFELEGLRTWLDQFPDWVTPADVRGKGSGFGDLSIREEFARQCRLNPCRRVYVWSLDGRLGALVREP